MSGIHRLKDVLFATKEENNMKKNNIPAHLILDLMAKGIFINQPKLSFSQMEKKMKAAQHKMKGGE